MSLWWVAGLVALCDGSGGLLTVAVVAAGLVGVFLVCYLSGLFRSGAAVRVGAFALRDRARSAYVRLCDPDAAGRPRPRAPSVNLVCA
jgi:Family of unknown function (DUF6412)